MERDNVASERRQPSSFKAARAGLASAKGVATAQRRLATPDRFLRVLDLRAYGSDSAFSCRAQRPGSEIAGKKSQFMSNLASLNR